ncbi:MAG: O-antigen ligase family protein [Prosthecobacter sp.]|jgi:O-antigen ligase|nr:O-antigen ligase family protein [Prosthecobacter sp.]
MSAHPHSPESLPARLMVWGCGTLLGLLAADAVIGSYNAGLLPLKPVLFTLGAVAACLGATLLNKPRFAPVVFLVLALPLVRTFDAIVLQRAAASHAGQTGMDLLRMMLVLVAILGVLSTEHGLRTVRWAAVLAILLTVASELAEAAGLAKFTSIPGRYSGFNGHPNFPPVLLCEMLGICFALLPSFRLNFLLICLSYVGVGLTYGRSGFVVLTLMSCLYILKNARRNLGFLLLCAAIAVPLAGAGVAILQSSTQKGITKDKNTADRMEAILNLDFEKLKSPERAKDLADGWEAVLQKPLLGHGTGMSGSRWVPHNEYVSLWLEMGIPGLLLFVGTLGALVLRSVMTGGTAGYLVFAIMAYTPAGQGRIEMPHFCLAISTAAMLLWPRRYLLVTRSASKSSGPTTQGSSNHHPLVG